MPLDIQIPYKGSDYLFQGISSGASGLAAGAEAAAKQYKQIQAAGKSADYAVKAAPEALMQMGITPEQWGTLGARDKAAAMQGFMQKMTMDKMQADNAEMMAHAQEYRQKAASQQTQDRATEALPRVMQSILERRKTMAGPGPGPDVDPGGEMDPNAIMSGAGPTSQAPGGPMKPEELMQAISEMGATNPKVAAALINKFMPMLTGTGEDQPAGWKSPAGNDYVRFKNTFLRDPRSDPSQMLARPVTDENGNVIAHALTDGKGKTTFVKPDRSDLTAADKAKLRLGYDKLHLDLLQAKRFAGPEPESQALYDKAIAENQSLLEGLRNNSSAAVAAPAANILELPKDVKQLKKGQVYKTGKGPAVWNGQAFEKQ